MCTPVYNTISVSTLSCSTAGAEAQGFTCAKHDVLTQPWHFPLLYILMFCQHKTTLKFQWFSIDLNAVTMLSPIHLYVHMSPHKTI